jgi:hypothetical protein
MMPPFALPPPDPGFEILLSSQGMSQGVALTDGPQIFPRVYLDVGDAQVGVQWRNLDSPAASGVAALFARYRHEIERIQLDFVARYRIRTGTSGPVDRTSWEFSASARTMSGPLILQVAAEYSPTEFGGGDSLYVEFVPGVTVDGATTISAGLGLRLRDWGADHRAFNLGVSRSIGRSLTLAVRYHDTDRHDLGTRFRGRIVLSARSSF